MILLWVRCARVWTTILRLRTGASALPFLVNHLQNHPNMEVIYRENELCKIGVYYQTRVD